MNLTCPVCKNQIVQSDSFESCPYCHSNLTSYVHLFTYPANLFNRALDAVTMGKLQLARDYFAAIVYWCPTDIEARKALALVCFKLGDTESAMEHWQSVLNRLPDDQMAKQGLEALARIQKSTKTHSKKQVI